MADTKLRPLVLLDILRAQTDEEHALTIVDLQAIMKEKYNMDAHRATIANDIQLLINAGFDIDVNHSTQNRYRYLKREFDIAELKMLVDAVQAYRVIPRATSEALVQKISSLAGRHKASELKRNLMVDGVLKQDNDRILYVVDSIYEAIAAHKKIRYQMTEHNVRKERVLRNDGEWYTFSPYALTMDGDFYYAVGFSDKYNKMSSLRVDRIYSVPEISTQNAVPIPEDFDINCYLSSMFRMFTVDREHIQLICANQTMDSILDKFGLDADVVPLDEQNFLLSAEIAPNSIFYNWIFGFQGLVHILSPNSVRTAYYDMLRKNLALAEDLEPEIPELQHIAVIRREQAKADAEAAAVEAAAAKATTAKAAAVKADPNASEAGTDPEAAESDSDPAAAEAYPDPMVDEADPYHWATDVEIKTETETETDPLTAEESPADPQA